jgi:hypothetical protein
MTKHRGTHAGKPQWWKHLRDWGRVFWKRDRIWGCDECPLCGEDEDDCACTV